ncbi:hypothetical protein Q4E93_00930 [Flavitalea sp. BT771]|uniref:hypothetical protein n=1 Tax=Flavitalea sp. BT771 TaxID=3063329 RepID=UPI0026E1B864|nr:hypothetical protein [Flavitalea sp. BT771]MDO6429129.1 hypothetical protein [Flavitalea sp. BT771]MDV6218743.1 hypothetical protein [Flavitalea sp. BT771]
MKLLPAYVLILLCPVLRAQDTTLSKYIPSHAYTIVHNESLAILDGWNGMRARFGIEHAWNRNWSSYMRGWALSSGKLPDIRCGVHIGRVFHARRRNPDF